MNLLRSITDVLIGRKMLVKDGERYKVQSCNAFAYSDSTGVVYNCIGSTPMSSKDIQTKTGYTVRMVQIATKRLYDCGLIDRKGGPFRAYVYWRKNDCSEEA